MDRNNPSFVTETERSVEFRYSIQRIIHKLLNRSGKIGGTAVHSCHFPNDQWCHFVSRLSEIEPSLTPRSSHILQKETAEPILHGNLGLETKILPTTRTTITAKTPAQFHAIRCFFSNSIGVGVRKRPPNKTDIRYGRRMFSLQDGDIVNFVDVNLEGLEDNADGNDWFADDAIQVHSYFKPERNYIRLMYDSRTRIVRITMKAMAVVTGNCDVKFIVEYLRANGVDWGSNKKDEEEVEVDVNANLRVRRGVVISNKMWMISTVDVNHNSVTLVRPNATQDGVTCVVTLAQARNGLTA